MKNLLKVYFTQAGGFAQIKKSLTLTEDMLTTEECRQLKGLIEKANFFDLTPYYPPPSHSWDFFIYDTTVKIGEQKHIVKTTDASTTPKMLSPLIEFLTTKIIEREDKWEVFETSNNFRIGGIANMENCPDEEYWCTNFFEEEFDHNPSFPETENCMSQIQDPGTPSGNCSGDCSWIETDDWKDGITWKKNDEDKFRLVCYWNKQFRCEKPEL